MSRVGSKSHLEGEPGSRQDDDKNDTMRSAQLSALQVGHTDGPPPRCNVYEL